MVTILASIVGTMVAFPLVRGGVRAPGVLRLAVHPADHDPGVPDRDRAADLLSPGAPSHPARPVHGGRRPPGLHDPVRRPDRGRPGCRASIAASSGPPPISEPSPWRTLRHIVLPLIAPAILAGALLCVTLSIDEFVITFFLIGPQQTLPLYIYTQIKFGVTPEVNAIATVILARVAVDGRARLDSCSTGSRRLRRRRGPNERAPLSGLLGPRPGPEAPLRIGLPGLGPGASPGPTSWRPANGSRRSASPACWPTTTSCRSWATPTDRSSAPRAPSSRAG